jgi:hypothetical protein
MAIDNDEVISTLNNLIETCKDGQNGFGTAAEGVKDSKLTTLFHTYSQQRAQFAAELQSEVRRLGGNPEETGSTAAVLHRGWINIKSALKNNLPADVRMIIESQFLQVKEAHDRIRSLEKRKAQSN